MPAIMPAPGTSPSYMSQAASWPISRNGEPGSSSRSTRSRGSSLPRDDVALAALLGAAQRGLGDVGAQLLGERAIVRGARAELFAVGRDFAVDTRCAHAAYIVPVGRKACRSPSRCVQALAKQRLGRASTR